MASASQQLRNWLELPSDIMANIFRRVDFTDVFESVQKVCTTWYKICKDPAMWRVIHMEGFLNLNDKFLFQHDNLCKLVVDRSQGQLVDLTVVGFYDKDKFLQYVADRSSSLRRLELAYCTCSFGCWSEVLKKFPLLEELNLYMTNISKEAIVTAGRHCPMLKTLKLNQIACRSWAGEHVKESIMYGNGLAKAIGENFTHLRHLELIGCNMSNMGLRLILDGCCHLESLDLRSCRHIDLNEDLQKRCLERIKHLKLPDTSLEGCPYLYFHYGLIASIDSINLG